MSGSRREADAFSGPRPRGLLALFSGTSGRREDDPEERKRSFDKVSRTVRKNYAVLSGDMDRSGIFFKVILDPETNEKKFDSLRISLRKMGFFPKLIDTGRETIIAIFPLPKRKPSNYTTNLVLLVLTIITTIWAGAVLWEERTGEMLELSDLLGVMIDPADLGMGALTFALPLLLILGIHELGHYFTSRRYMVDASLPYFIPVPPLISPFGTFGALISMKEPISNRKALVDIGAAGPVSGFIVAIPVTLIGLALTGYFPSTTGMVEGMTYIQINPPLLFRAMMLPLGVSMEDNLFPTAIAGWIGLFVTSINLFPAGQLDGGHISRGVLGTRGKYLSFATVAVLLVLGFTTPFKTYLLFAFLILLMGTDHPPPLDDVSSISKRQYAAAGFALLIMVLTFHPVPLEIVDSPMGGVNVKDAPEQLNLSSEYPVVFDMTLENDGRLEKDVRILFTIGNETVLYDALQSEPDWNTSTFGPLREVSTTLLTHDGWYIMLMDPFEMKVEGGEGKTLTWSLVMGCSRQKEAGEQTVMNVGFSTENEVSWTSIVITCTGPSP